MQSTPVASITELLLDKLKHAFRQDPVTPNSSWENTMYQAGQQSVIEWLEAHKRQETQMLGDINATRMFR